MSVIQICVAMTWCRLPADATPTSALRDAALHLPDSAVGALLAESGADMSQAEAQVLVLLESSLVRFLEVQKEG